MAKQKMYTRRQRHRARVEAERERKADTKDDRLLDKSLEREGRAIDEATRGCR